MRPVVIFGYFGRGNLGDETNLRELVSFLRQVDPQVLITVISASPYSTENLRVNSIGKYDLFKIIRAFRKSRFLIGGGGSIFQDQSSIRSLFYYTALVFLAGWSGMDIFLYGQGIGPLCSGVGKLMARWALSRVKMITVRDRFSLSMLASLKVSGPEIHHTAEPLLLKEPLPESEVKRYWDDIAGRDGYKLGLIPLENRVLNIRFWRRLLFFLQSANIELYWLIMAESDWRRMHKLAISFKIKILPVQNRWEILQQAVGGLDLVVSARLHGLVAAVVQGTPCYGLALDPKIAGFCIPLKINYSRLSKANPLLLSNQILRFTKQPAAPAENRRFRLNFWKRYALQNQLYLKKFIMGENPPGEL